MNVYVACALTHVPRRCFKQHVSFIHHLVEAICASGSHHVTYALVNSDPQLASKPFDEKARLCYLWDRELIQQADLVIAEGSFPSTGMGIELQIADDKGIPVIICFKRNPENRMAPVEYENPDHTHHTLQIGEGYVSLMALGLSSVFKVIGYSTEEEGITSVVEAIGLFQKDLSDY